MLYFARELHKFIVTSVAVTERGRSRLLVTGSGDGTVRIIKVPERTRWMWRGLITLALFLTLLVYFGLFAPGAIFGGEGEL